MRTAPSLHRSIRRTRPGRLADYVEQMFPLAVYVPSGLACFLSIHLSLQAANHAERLHLGWRTVAGALSVVLFSLLLRITDELKDVESDRALAREGDPRYLNRVVVTGHVSIEDLSAFRRGVTLVLLALNLAFPSSVAWAGFFLALASIWLSSRWFFWPRIRDSLLLAFLTHSPLAAVVGIYVVSVYAGEFGMDAVSPVAIAAVLASWLPIAAWETSRKVRIPEDETRYQTYSKLLGWRWAAWSPAIFATLASVAVTFVAIATQLPAPFLGGVVVANIIVALGSLRFRLRPTRKNANLRPFAELYALVVTVGTAAALLLTRGVAW